MKRSITPEDSESDSLDGFQALESFLKVRGDALARRVLRQHLQETPLAIQPDWRFGEADLVQQA